MEGTHAMKAGRELDALIAEQVMGWTYHPYGNGGGKWLDAAGKQVAFGGLNGGSLPHYSTAIADAWAVVEQLSCTTKQYWTIEYFSTGCVATFNLNDFEYQSSANTAPLAICLTALQAVGRQGKEET